MFIYSAHGQGVGLKIDNGLAATQRIHKGLFLGAARFGCFAVKVGNNVIYLDKYLFNGKEYPLRKEVLPPVSAYNGFHYIYLPTDGTTHVSFEIDFYDWQNKMWKTKGYADFRNGLWEITYSPCEQKI